MAHSPALCVWNNSLNYTYEMIKQTELFKKKKVTLEHGDGWLKLSWNCHEIIIRPLLSVENTQQKLTVVIFLQRWQIASLNPRVCRWTTEWIKPAEKQEKGRNDLKREEVSGLTRRAQVLDSVEKQGDPESAGWTSPETQARCCPSWIHSSGSVLNLRPLLTSTTLKILIASPSKKVNDSKYSALISSVRFIPPLFPKRTKTLWVNMWGSGRKLTPSLLVCVSFLLAGAQLTFPLSVCLPNWTQSFLQTSLSLAPTGATWLWLAMCRHLVFITGTAREQAPALQVSYEGFILKGRVHKSVLKQLSDAQN